MTDDSFTSALYVDSARLRQRFNELDLLGELHRGEIVGVVDWERPAQASAGQIPGTVSQRIFYYREDKLVAVVHQYVRPDGSIGGSGRPDPKWLRDGDVILKYRASH